jgi:hypothetical protein
VRRRQATVGAQDLVLDVTHVFRRTYSRGDHSQGNPRFDRRTGSVQAKPVARLECIAEAPFGSFRDGKRCDSAPGRRPSMQREIFWNIL